MRRASSVGDPLWDASVPPDRGPAFVIADGFASSSTTTTIPRYEHLSVQLGRAIRNVLPSANVTAFSYTTPGHSYAPTHTNVRVGTATSRLVQPYDPRPDVAFAYVCFSLAAPIYVLGLDAWYGRPHASIDPVDEQRPRLILFQPALGLADIVRDAVRAREDPALLPIKQFAQSGTALRDGLFTALDRLTHVMDVAVVLWPGDRFIDYSPATMARLRDANVTVVELPPPRDPDGRLISESTTDPFLMHAAVGPDRDAHRRIAELCRRDR